MVKLRLEEAFDKYAKDVAGYETETEMTEEDIRIMDSKKDNIYNNIMKEIDKDKKKKFPAKIIIPLVAILILVVAYSSNAFAFRTFLHQTFMTLTGTDLNLNVKKLIFDDYNNIINFETKEDIVIPVWLPDDMELYKIIDEKENLNLYFKTDECWVTLDMKLSSSENITTLETKKNDYHVKKTRILDMDCDVVKMVSEADFIIYSAYFNSENINYSIMTNASKEDFDKILGNLQYLED